MSPPSTSFKWWSLDFLVRVNVVCVTPLCENLPGPSANEPGDVYARLLQIFLPADPSF